MLHEAVDGRLVTRLEERRDGERGDAAVVVVDELLHVEVACLHGGGVRLRELSEGSNRSKLKGRLGSGEEQLED